MMAGQTASNDIPWGKIAVGAAVAAGVGGAGYLAYKSMKKAVSSTAAGNDKPKVARVPPRQAGPQHLKTQGNECFKKGDYQKAIDYYTKAIEEAPPDQVNEIATYYQNRAAAHEKLDQSDLAMADCNKALELNWKYTKAYSRRARLAAKSKQYQLALEDLTCQCIMENFAIQGTVEEADRILRLCAENKAKEMYTARGDSTVPVSTSFVDTYLTSFCDDPIMRSLDQVQQVRDAGDQPLSGYDSARLALVDKKYDRVVKECTREINSENSSKLLEALLLRATFALIEGNARMARRDFDRFLEEFKKLDPDEQTSRKDLLSNAYIKRGSYFMQLGQKTESMSDFELAIQANSENADIYHHRGQLYLIMGEMDKATSDFEKCLKIRPDFLSAKCQALYAEYASALANQSYGGVVTAITKFELFMQENPQCGEGFALLGQIYSEREAYDDAAKMFDSALKYQPQNANIQVHKGLLQLRKMGSNPEPGDHNRCMETILSATKIDPHCEFVYEVLGQVEVQRGHLGQAVEYFDRALNLARTELELTHIFGLKLAADAQIESAKRLHVDIPTQ